MGCGFSCTKYIHLYKIKRSGGGGGAGGIVPRQTHAEQTEGNHQQNTIGEGGVPAFAEFSFLDLKSATDNFSSDNIVSERGAVNSVYKGKITQNNRTRWIAVKKFTKMAWPDPRQFAVSIVNFAPYYTPINY